MVQKAIIVALVLVFVLAVTGFMVVFKDEQGDAVLYFNAESDLPDPLLGLKEGIDANTTPVHKLMVNETYSIIFSVYSPDRRPFTYKYLVRSTLINKTDEITLNPSEIKNIRLEVTPREQDKWILNSTYVGESENVFDITENSWLAEKRDFDVLVRKEGLPTILEENYHLPISSSLTHFGEIYHMNITLDELREKPFQKEFTSEVENVFDKTVSENKIQLGVEGNKLRVKVSTTTRQYISETNDFTVKLIQYAPAKKKVTVDTETDIESIQQISFLYKIK